MRDRFKDPFNFFWSDPPGKTPHEVFVTQFDSANRSIVRSIRQRDLLNSWLRAFKRAQSMPLIHQFQPDHLEDEKPDLMYYEVKGDSEPFRFLILHGGKNLVKLFGTVAGEGWLLDDLVGPERYKHIIPTFNACIAARRPIYTVSPVEDVSGVPVSYERLVLPFGASNKVQHLIASLKTISVEGRFTSSNLMRPDAWGSAHQVSAVIDQDIDTALPVIAAADDVVEL